MKKNEPLISGFKKPSRSRSVIFASLISDPCPQVLLGRDLPRPQLPARARHHLQRLEAGQRSARPRGPHQAHGLRHVQGGHPAGRHHLDFLR